MDRGYMSDYETKNKVSTAFTNPLTDEVSPISGKDLITEYNKLAKEVTESIKPLKEIEREYILQVVDLLDNNKTAAAKALGISVKGLYNKLHEYGFNFKNEGDKQ